MLKVCLWSLIDAVIMYDILSIFGFELQQSAQYASYISTMCMNKVVVERQGTIELKSNIFVHKNNI